RSTTCSGWRSTALSPCNRLLQGDPAPPIGVRQPPDGEPLLEGSEALEQQTASLRFVGARRPATEQLILGPAAESKRDPVAELAAAVGVDDLVLARPEPAHRDRLRRFDSTAQSLGQLVGRAIELADDPRPERRPEGFQEAEDANRDGLLRLRLRRHADLPSAP